MLKVLHSAILAAQKVSQCKGKKISFNSSSAARVVLNFVTTFIRFFRPGSINLIDFFYFILCVRGIKLQFFHLLVICFYFRTQCLNIVVHTVHNVLNIYVKNKKNNPSLFLIIILLTRNVHIRIKFIGYRVLTKNSKQRTFTLFEF